MGAVMQEVWREVLVEGAVTHEICRAVLGVEGGGRDAQGFGERF
jgi:hypothetical protein